MTLTVVGIFWNTLISSTKGNLNFCLFLKFLLNVKICRYLAEENQDTATRDTRVHCVLYFISPYGRGLKPLDVLVMRQLANKANLIPVIAKADCLTKEETKKLKERVLEELDAAGIRSYQLPHVAEGAHLRQSLPFAICGANVLVELGGRLVRGRQYPWGLVEVENPDHCDFGCLRSLLTTHVGHLREITNTTFYERVRSAALLPFQRQAEAMEKRRHSSSESNFNNNFIM